MGIAWSFALLIWFGGSLKQRHFAHFGKRQKLVNYRGLKWVLLYRIEINTVMKFGPTSIMI